MPVLTTVSNIHALILMLRTKMEGEEEQGKVCLLSIFHSLKCTFLPVMQGTTLTKGSKSKPTKVQVKENDSPLRINPPPPIRANG